MQRKSVSFFHQFYPALFLMLVAVVGLLPVFFFSLKFDNLDQYLPWRFLVSESLRGGMLPLWNPYTHLGYPLYADPQSGSWYPFVWIASIFSDYNMFWLHFEYIFHVWLAGFGMYLLCNELIKHRNVALLAGSSYMLSGFFTGNTQHLTWIISGCWCVFILYFFLKSLRTRSYNDAVCCALSFFMLLTGGYPAFSIIIAYALALFSFVYIIRKYSRNDKNTIYIIIPVLIAVLTFLFSSVMVMSIMKSFEIAGRAEGLTKAAAMANPFSPQSMDSFLFPLPSVRRSGFFDTDPSMSNGFFGVMMFAGFILSFFIKSNFTKNFILGCSLFCLLASMGSYTPLRSLLYNHLPFLDLFRMPSLFRLFAIIGFILIGAITLKNIYSNEILKGKVINLLKIFAAVVLATIAGIIITGNAKNISNNYFMFADISLPNSFIIQGIVIVLSILLFNLLLKNKVGFQWLVIDLIVSAWICAPVTMISLLPYHEVSSYFENFDHSFSIPATTPMIQNKDRVNTIGPFWCNLGILRKQPIYDGYNNFQTRQYNEFEKNLSAHDLSHGLKNGGHGLKNDVLENPIVFMKDLKTDDLSIIIKQFKPLLIICETNAATASELTLMQQADEGWKIYVDGNPASYRISYGLFMSVPLERGKHEVEFKFQDKKITITLYISGISILISFLFLIFRKRKVLS
jgi:hypothetical protein